MLLELHMIIYGGIVSLNKANGDYSLCEFSNYLSAA